MSTYIMSDIHGCYNDFHSMLEKIGFSDLDQLIIAGDYIDRGKQSFKMLKWIEHCPPNVLLLRGNHEQEFATYVDLMLLIDRSKELKTDFDSNIDTFALYESVKYFIQRKALTVSYFDLYGTINALLAQNHITLRDLCRWSEKIRQMPYYHKLMLKNKKYIIVHAGYSENVKNIDTHFGSLERFYLYAREESCQFGGVHHGTIIAGHTPTIIKGHFAYNKGNVFRYYDIAKDCTFYDIDCGCVFRNKHPDAKLACIRLEDEEIFYI
ncbi:MAG: metallophosphoesterase [Lachnospiraceae bacterium]